MLANIWSGMINLVWGLITLLAMLALFSAPIWVVYQWVKYFSQNKDNALDVAKERYASGEITKAEFEDIKNTIQ